MDQFISLGKTGLNVSSLGLGTMQWGYQDVINQKNTETYQVINEIFKVSLDRGINFFDTAEIYGRGKSEKILGQTIQNNRKNIIIASKFMPYPWRFSKGELRKALIKSLKRLELEQIDLYQIHWPFPPVTINVWMDAMADMVEDGLINAVGVSNYSVTQTQKAYERLATHRIPLASNQVKFNILDRRPESTGLLDLCRELGITIIAYSPLERGILTGKYNQSKIPPDYRSWRYNRSHLKKIEPLLNELHDLGKKYGNKTPGQVALNWLISKGALAIPGAKTVAQAKENAGALGWYLSKEDVSHLDKMSDQVIN